jgi:hypothetical protein
LVCKSTLLPEYKTLQYRVGVICWLITVLKVPETPPAAVGMPGKLWP